ncbi:MAG: TraV family lipoprotein [Candidatus Dadabacteria bacterium]|nr:TraV family lipoprotein [Candidatus Dadabacteria bacterium]MYA48765.1 TraV family lipoprotein [Candidatus Dadabacteria bacterium]MYK50050.1 TraV family lipoprotein [Candidatus Dadabacteria bacterium]
MRRLQTLLLLLVLSGAACGGGSSRYGCPVKSGLSCKSVSEVYAEASGAGADPLYESPVDGKSALPPARMWRRVPKGTEFRAGKDARGPAEGGKDPGARAGNTGAMPVYAPPPVMRLWIAPWQDARGVFHSEKYVYVLVGKGRWTIGGKEIPIGAHEEELPGDIRLRGTRRAP